MTIVTFHVRTVVRTTLMLQLTGQDSVSERVSE